MSSDILLELMTIAKLTGDLIVFGTTNVKMFDKVNYMIFYAVKENFF